MLKRLGVLGCLLVALVVPAAPAHASGYTSVQVRDSVGSVIWPSSVQMCVAATPLYEQGTVSVRKSNGIVYWDVAVAYAGTCSPWVFVPSYTGAYIAHVQVCDAYGVPGQKIVTTCSDWVPVRPGSS
jgi:hypothetical protein